jgi:hypothetical protein
MEELERNTVPENLWSWHRLISKEMQLPGTFLTEMFQWWNVHLRVVQICCVKVHRRLLIYFWYSQDSRLRYQKHTSLYNNNLEGMTEKS